MMRRRHTPKPDSLRERFHRPPQVVSPRERVEARPLRPRQPPERKPVPLQVESPESGDDWRAVWSWAQERWEELRAHPLGVFASLWERLLRWWESTADRP